MANTSGDFNKRVGVLSQFEKMRKERHSGERIIADHNSEAYWANLQNETLYVYSNKVITERCKVPKLIPTIKRNKTIGLILQLLAVVLLAFVMYALFFMDMSNSILLPVLLVSVCMFIAGGIVSICGRRAMGEYIEVWNPLKAPMEIRKLRDGRIAIVSYLVRNIDEGEYLSCFDSEGKPVGKYSIFDIGKYRKSAVVKSCYIIDKVKGVKRVKDGIELKSQGQFYGLRIAHIGRTGSRSGGVNHTGFYAWTECTVDNREELIPSIFNDMDNLYDELRRMV